MKTLGRITVLLVVLGLCVPSFGEILIYKLTESGTFYEEVGVDDWEVDKDTGKGYMVIDIDYGTGEIVESALAQYGVDAGEKWFEMVPLNLEVVRVDDGTRVTWIVMEKDIDDVGGEPSGSFHLLAGTARDKNVGTGTNEEVASKLSGYGLEDNLDGDRSIGLSKVSATFYASWTYWANGDEIDEGNQDFGTVMDEIAAYLEDKGYTEI
jgi:hypothetical protein